MDINKMDEAIKLYREIKDTKLTLKYLNEGKSICITRYDKGTNYSREYHEILTNINDDIGAVELLEEYYRGKLYVLEAKLKKL